MAGANKMNNGMIAFMRDQVIPGPVMLDIEITNTFPLISLTETTELVYGEGQETLTGYDHISIPSDFRLHVTGEKEHIFFDVTPVLDLLQNHNNEPIHYFTIVGLPAGLARDLIKPGETRTWHEAMIISPFKDGLYNDSTRLFVDFFLHNSEIAQEDFIKFPFASEGMRLAGDAHGAVIGPHSFASIQRKRRNNHDLMFTMRFGYMEMESSNITYIHTPLKVFQRREKRPTHIPKT